MFFLLSWLFVFVVALHNLEEAIWLPRWSSAASRWHLSTGGLEFRFAVLILTLLAGLAAWLAMVQGKGSFGAYALTGFALAMLLNVFFPHLLATIITRSYMPGTATAVLLILPVTLALLKVAHAEQYVEFQKFLLIGPLVVLAIVLLIPLLFRIGRTLSRGGTVPRAR